MKGIGTKKSKDLIKAKSFGKFIFKPNNSNMIIYKPEINNSDIAVHVNTIKQFKILFFNVSLYKNNKENIFIIYKVNWIKVEL